jgi:hypothetical protein
MKTFFINMLLIFTATLSFAQVPNYVPTNGLVGWWPFSGNAIDSSGNGNNGTVNGATLTADRNGLASKAYSFDGVDDFIDCPDNPFDFGANDFTVSAWINRGSSSNYGMIFSKERALSPDIYQFRLFISNGIYTNALNKACFFIQDANNNFLPQPTMPNGYNLQSNSPIQVNQWVHIVIVRNGINYNFFQDGILIATAIAPAGLNFSNNNNFRIGARYTTNGTSAQDFFNGKIDDIAFWNRALTQCEISDLYNAQVGSSATSNTLTQSSCNSFTLNNQTYTQSGTYTQNLTNAAGCDSIITLNLTINNSPIASSSSTGATFHGATDGSVNLTVSGGAAPYSFNWSNGANTEDLNAVAAGTYNVTITDANNCSSTTSVTVNQPPLALVKSPESLISSALYPNPATSQTRLDLQLNQAQDFEIAVYNNLGQRLFNKNFSNTKELSENIDMRSWPAGQYFVEIKLPNGTETKKLIKE